METFRGRRERLAVVKERGRGKPVELGPASPATAEERAAIAAGLRAIMQVQDRNANLLPPGTGGDSGTRGELRTAHQALMVELGEVYNALELKPWKKETPIDAAHVIDEVGGDVLHFLGWMLNAIERVYELTPDQFAHGFWAKSIENIARFQGKVPGREPPDTSSTRPLGGGAFS